MKNLLILITLFSITSCAFHSGTFNGSAAINNNQFRIAGTAHGTAKTTLLLGLGGLGKEGLVQEAKKNMHAKYPLQKGMAWGNVTVDFKITYVLIVRTTKAIVSADIIDFNPATINANYTGFYTEDSTYFPARNINTSKTENYNTDFNENSIKVNDEITFRMNENLVVGQIIAINSYGIKCKYETPQGSKKIYLLPEDISLR
jgi:hypothetical protein